jgi:hypothetical protein
LSREVPFEVPRVWRPEGIHGCRPRELELGDAVARNDWNSERQQRPVIRTRQRHD